MIRWVGSYSALRAARGVPPDGFQPYRGYAASSYCQGVCTPPVETGGYRLWPLRGRASLGETPAIDPLNVPFAPRLPGVPPGGASTVSRLPPRTHPSGLYSRWCEHDDDANDPRQGVRVPLQRTRGQTRKMKNSDVFGDRSHSERCPIDAEGQADAAEP